MFSHIHLTLRNMAFWKYSLSQGYGDGSLRNNISGVVSRTFCVRSYGMKG